MPRFAANLSMMFTEVPFIERFAAVAVHKKRECDPKKMRHHVVSHFK